MSDSFSFLTRSTVEHEVLGKKFQFKAMSAGALMRLKGVAKPVLTAIGSLFVDKRNDVSQETVTASGRDGEASNRISLAAASVDVIKQRSAEREAALSSLIESALGDEIALVLYHVLYDALPDYIEQQQGNTAQAEWVRGIEVGVLVEMLQGVYKANEKLLLPFKERAAEAAAALKGRLAPGEDDSPETTPPTSSSDT